MKLGMSGAVFYGRMETEDEAAHLTDFPLDVCEIFLETQSEYSASFGAQVLERLKGLPCVSVHPKGTQFEPDLFGRSRRQVEDAMRLFTGVCAAGEALHARYYVLHGPGGGPVAADIAKINALQERMARMRGIAQAHGLALLWENVCWCALRCPKDIEAAKRLVPGIGFVLDVKQAHRGGQDCFAMLEAMGQDVRHVHLLDWNAEGGLCLPGRGVLDLDRLLRQLRDQGFDGALMLEPYDWQGRDEGELHRSLDFLRGAMVRAGVA